MRKQTGLLLVVMMVTRCHDALTPVKGPPLEIPAQGPSAIAKADKNLEVIHMSPKGQLSAEHAQVTVSFSKPMVALQRVDERAAKTPLVVDPPIQGKIRWLGSRTLTIQLDRPLPGSTAYQLRIPAGTKALDGSALKEEVKWAFSTPRLNVTRSSLSWRQRRWAHPSQPVQLSFNQPLAPKELRRFASFKVTPAGSNETLTIASDVGYDHKKRPLNQRDVVIQPATPLPLNAKVVLEIAPGAVGLQGPLPMTQIHRTAFATYSPFVVKNLGCKTGCAPQQSITVHFSTPVSQHDARAAIRLNGKKVAGSKSHYPTASVYLGGNLKPRTTYTLTVAPGLKDQFGQLLGGEKRFTFSTGDFEPYASLPTPRQGLVETNGPTVLPLHFRNANKASVLWGSLTPRDVSLLLKKDNYDYNNRPLLAEQIKVSNRELRVAGKPNRRITERLELQTALKGRKGIVAVELQATLQGTDGKPFPRVHRSVLRISDLAINAKYAPSGSLVWVTSLAQGKPVSGAEVSIWRVGEEKPRWTGLTDGSGLAVGPGTVDLGSVRDNHRFIFFATKGTDSNYVLSSNQGGISPWDFGIDATWDDGRTKLRGVLFSDRGLYRPGEKVELKGILRKLDDNRLKLAGGKVTVRVDDSRGEKIIREEVQLTEFGTFNIGVKIPASAPLGSYSVSAKHSESGSVRTSFRVEEYRPAEFSVDASSDRKHYVRGDTLNWKTKGRYLFGSPMRRAEFKWSVYRRRSTFSPPGHDGFVFQQEIDWWSDKKSYGGYVARGKSKLDEQGLASGKLALRPPVMNYPLSHEFESSVTDISRQRISSRTTVILHPGEFYLGIKPKELFVKAGESIATQVLAVDLKGKRIPNVNAAGELVLRTWHSVRKKGMKGAHYFETRPKDTLVGKCSITTAKDATTCDIVPKVAGYYALRMSATDSRGNAVHSSTSYYVTGKDFVPWRRDNDNKVELITDRKSYQLGQVAKILIKSPFAGAYGLFTVERNGVIIRKGIRLDKTTMRIEVPITEDLLPNAYASVMLVRGRVTTKRKSRLKPDEEDPNKPAFRIGYVKLQVSSKPHRLSVAVTPGNKEYRPGQEAVVEVQVKNAQGQGVASEVTLIAADEGVLMLSGFQLPDPISVFYAGHGLSVRTADNHLALIDRQVFGEKGKDPGGGGGGFGESARSGQKVRRNFITTAYYNPSVVTDASGRATVRFKLPDNLTTFRLMAMAVSKSTDFGKGRSAITVNKPLLLLPTLPRTVRVGDSIEAGVVVHNHSGRNATVKITATVVGLALEGSRQHVLTIAEGAAGEARFKYRAEHPGEAVFRFKAEFDEHQDLLELRRPVNLPLVMESVAAYGSTDTAAAERVIPSASIRDDVGGLEVTMASTALVGLRPSLEYLTNYPYGCVEQTTSRLVPLVLFKDLMQEFKLELPKKLDAFVAEQINRIQTMQLWDGGFSYWPSGRQSYAWASAYAAWGLKTAQKLGHPVSPQVLNKAKRYLEQELRRKPKKGEQQLSNNLKTYLVFVLQELGGKADGYTSVLYKSRKDLATFGKALLLTAMVRAKGDATAIETLADDILNSVHQTAGEAKVEESLGREYAEFFHSNTRSTAMVLNALLEYQPKHHLVDKLVRHLLARRRNGRWRNTQETVYGLLSLHQFYKKREALPPAFTATVTLGDKNLVSQDFKGRSLKIERHKLPMSQLKTESGILGFQKKGDGTLYYTARLNYARATLPRDAWDEGFAVKRTYQRVSEDAGASASQLAQGKDPKASTATVKAGDMVRVKLQIVVPQQMHFVALEDPLPAGLEALNFNLMTTSQSARRRWVGHSYGSQYGRGRHWSSYTPFYHRETRDDRILLFADRLEPGVYEYVYLARATTVGNFVAPPTHIEEMYAPEVFGRTGTSTFVVSGR